jgi:5-methylcytosine-specific restriction endonuclease McrA
MMATALTSITDIMLQQRVLELRQRERKLTVELLVHLAEVERRRLYFAMGHDSLFKLLHDGLGYSKGGAYRRLIAARLLVRYPVITDYLRDGRLNLTQLSALHPILTDDNVDAALAEAVGKSEDLLRAMVAGRQGKPVETSSVRVIQVAPPLALALPVAPAVAGVAAAPIVDISPAAMQPIPVVQDELHLVRVVVDKAFIDDLEAVRDALSHKYPDRDLAEVLRECLQVTLGVIRRQQEGSSGSSSRPPTRPPAEGSRHVPLAVRRQVMQRDGRRCAHVGPDGHRCSSTYQIQLHHLEPFATGGPPTAANLEVRCRRHNHLHAREELGDRFIALAIARSRRRPRSGSSRNQITAEPSTPSDRVPTRPPST